MKKSSSISILILCILLLIQSARLQNVEQLAVQYPYIIVQPAHILADDSLTLLYRDVSKDVAIYMREDYIPTKPEVGTIVNSADTRIHGSVVSVEDYGFTFQLDTDSDLYRGDSGTYMYSDGEYVGFISRADMDGRIYVVSY